MLFKDLVPLSLYRGQTHCPVPKGNPVGTGEAIVLLTPSNEDSLNLLGKGSYLYYREGMYRNYFMDTVLREKIGNKTINQKIDSKEIEKIETYDFDTSLNLIRRGSTTAFIKRKKNVIIDLGQWNEKYFAYQRKLNPLHMAEAYVNFLTRRLKESEWKVYNQTIFIDAKYWSKQLNTRIVFEADQLNNPITMILFLLYKNSPALEELQEYDFVIFNSETKAILYIDGESIVHDNFGKIKSRISNIITGNLNVEDIQNLSIEDETAMISSGTTTKDQDAIRLAKIRSRLQSNISKEFIGNDDEAIDTRISDSENLDDDIEVSVSDPDLSAEIEKFVDEIMNSEDDIDTLEETSTDQEKISGVARKISENVYIHSFMPKYSKVEINRIERLTEKQNKVIPKITPEMKAKSKIIDERDISQAVNIPNEDFLTLKFSNFDSSYNEKKLESDIDSAITMLGSGTRKVFITSKDVVDSSNQLTLKETRTYHLEDETGKKMTLKFDVPKIIDDRYMYINGNKKILQHQFVTKPIIKNKENEVKINTWYNKLIIQRVGLEDANASPIQKYLMKHDKEFNVRLGNGRRKNNAYIETLESALISKRIYSFKVGGWHIITAIDDMINYIKKQGVTLNKVTATKYPIGFNTNTKEVLYFDTDNDSYADKIIGLFDETDVKEIKKRAISSRQFYARCEIMKKSIPIALIILHTIGLTEMLKLANIETIWISRENRTETRKYDKHEWGITELADGYLLWKREPMESGMLMNGVNQIDFKIFTREEMDSKDTYIYTLNQFYKHSNMSFNLDQFANFMIDEVTKEILEDFHLPTTYCELLLLANKLLVRMDYIPETDTRNMRIRSNELIPLCIYKAVTNAYGEYRKSWTKRHPISISVKSDAVMRLVLESALAEEESVLNPFLELEKGRAISVRGNGGINQARAVTLPKRAYSESMLGIVGITTSPDANVGVARQLTLEPLVTSTRGYMEFKGRDNVDELTAANLLTPGELLTPLGIEHDDPVRSAMAVKQSKYMIPIDDSEPGMITNGIDRVLPYHMGKEFVIVAEDDGVVVEAKNGLVVVKYNNGKYQTIDTSTSVKKNGSAGFWIVTNMVCEKKKGDIVKKNEVVGYEKQTFQKNNDDLSATMTRGPFVKIALVPRWDCYEDSNPITSHASDSLASTMAMEEIFSLNPKTVIHSIAKVGDIVNSGDVLIAYDEFSEDEEVQELMNIMRDKLKKYGDDFIQSASTTKKVEHTGEIVDIKIYSTVPLEEMSPSMQKVVGEYYDKLNQKINTIKKYKNPGDSNYYMSGQRISEFPEPIAPDARGRLKGEIVGDGGIVFCFYIKYKDYIKKGDKITAEFALKGIASQIIDPGLESYSEYRPDEEIGLIIAPHSPMNRKTTGIFKSMFINKLLIERKRQITDYWNSVRNTLKNE